MAEPRDFLIKLPRRVKDKATGQYVTVYDDYLQVKYRVVLFRERFPHGHITTEEILVDLERGYARYKTTVDDGEGGTATGYGTETQADFGDFAERAETRAVGRALALMGFGTEFVGQDLTEGEHVADAPVTNGQPDTPAPAPTPTNGKASPTQPPTSTKVSVEQLDGLFLLATETCSEDAEVFATRLRRIMQLPPNASVAKRLLAKTMTPEQYAQAWTYYQTLLAQLTRKTTQEGQSDGTLPQNTSVAEPAQPPTPEEPPAVPLVASLSAPASIPVEAPPAEAGPGPNTPEGYATPQQIAALKKLAAQVGPEAAEDLQDVLDHAPKGLVSDLYRRIEARLEGRLNGKKAAAVA
jgi:hypothetical protein